MKKEKESNQKIVALGPLMDADYAEFKKGPWFEHGIKPLAKKIQYPENYIRRIFDDAWAYGRVSQINNPAAGMYKTYQYDTNEMNAQIIMMRALGIKYPENGFTFEIAVNSLIMLAASTLTKQKETKPDDQSTDSGRTSANDL
jgi:hypothetical protein